MKLLSEKEIWALVMQQYPRTEKEKEGCPTEMERMYLIRREYKYELIALNEAGHFDKVMEEKTVTNKLNEIL